MSSRARTRTKQPTARPPRIHPTRLRHRPPLPHLLLHLQLPIQSIAPRILPIAPLRTALRAAIAEILRAAKPPLQIVRITQAPQKMHLKMKRLTPKTLTPARTPHRQHLAIPARMEIPNSHQ